MVTQTLTIIFKNPIRGSLTWTIKKNSVLVLEGTVGFTTSNNVVCGYNLDVIDSFDIRDN